MTTAIQANFFDYAALDTETRIVVQQRTTEIKALMKRAASDIIEIGQKLIEVKGRLGHGNFGGWLTAEFEWSYPTAARFMQVAEQFKSINLINLDIAPSALYLLAAPSTPDSAREEAIIRAEEGEMITYSAARGIVHDHKYPSEPYAPLPFEPEADDLPIEADETVRMDDGYISQMKPKINRAGDMYEPSGYDACQTPGYAIDPLLPYLPMEWSIWEPACGEGNLVEAFYDASRTIVGTDIITGTNFFACDGPEAWDCLITNPPYSIKYQWLERCYVLGRPFALLLPVETLGAKTAQELFSQHGLELILLDQRINFKMPIQGWDGKGAQFPVAWFTWGLDIGQQITFARVPRDRN